MERKSAIYGSNQPEDSFAECQAIERVQSETETSHSQPHHSKSSHIDYKFKIKDIYLYRIETIVGYETCWFIDRYFGTGIKLL